MMKKHILVISQYFHPEQFRINDICQEWIKRGYQVTVITGIPNYPQGKFYKGFGFFRKRNEIYEGIKIKRIPLIPRGKSSLFLALNYLSFVISGLFWKIFTKIKADAVFIYEVSPMTQALPGVWYAKRRKIPCYIYVTDLWPENVEIITGTKSKFIINSIGAMVDYIYRRCDRIFTSSKSFINEISKRGVPIEKIEFWPQYAENYYLPMIKENVTVPEIPIDGKFNIIFAGNIGTAQGLEILPQATKILVSSGITNFRFNIVGDGRYKEELIKIVNEQFLANYFHFIAKQPADKIPEFMAVSDAALICLAKSKVFSITLPAKTQSCLACGIPILVSADGEIQDVIKEANAGLCSDAGDSEMLADKVIEFLSKTPDELAQMARNGVEYYHENFDKDKLLNIMDKYLN